MITPKLVTVHGLSEDVTLDNWQEKLRDVEGFLWIDVRQVNQDDIKSLAERFGFHEVCVESCLNPYTRPTLHQFKDHICLNLTTIGESSDGQIDPEELHIFTGERYLVTVISERKNDALNALSKEYLEDPELADRGTLYAMYLIAQALVDSYMPLVERLDESVDHLETEMLEQADKPAMQRLFVLKRQLYDLRRLLGPQRDVFTELARRQFSFAKTSQDVYFNDLYSRMIYLFDIMDTIREAQSNALDIYLSATSNRLNEIMKVLTVAAIILMTLSFYTGFYGMNFRWLPWLNSPNAFRNMIGLMLATVGFMLYMFRRKKWM